MARDVRWRIREDVAWVGDNNRVRALSLQQPVGSPVAFNGTAAAIWLALESSQPVSVADLTHRIAEDFGVEPQQIAADVTAFLEDLQQSKVIESA